MKAIVLCGGKGTRLRPYTYSLPKPMLPLGEKPMLEFVLNNLKKAGVRDFIMTVGYLKETIMEHFGDGGRFGLNIEYSIEEKEMNTAGSIVPLRNKIDGSFVVAMGDHLSMLNMKAMIAAHRKSGDIATIALKKQGVPLDYGIAEVDGAGHITRFLEKPILQNLINSGMYVFEPEIFDYIKPGEDFAQNVFPKLLKDGKKINAYVFNQYWIDIGRVKDYEQLNETISLVDLVLGHHESKQ
ncbi:MAG: nucleotidyltransferase family protein [Candidatus Micrarchaeota archaeon]|nr:nucleotidyltransferase family protein [Candidatus Micrarchaeota archaeon]